MSDEAAVAESPVESHLDDIFNTNINETITEPPSEETQGLGEEVSQEAETEPQAEAQPDVDSQLQEQINTLTKQLENSQNMISRQGNEIGDLRKANAPEERTSEQFLDDFAKDPEGTNRAQMQAELDRREQTRAAQAEVVASNRQAVLSIDPEFDNKITDIKTWYKDKGASQEFVNSISANSLSQNVDLSAALSEVMSLKQQLAETKSKNTGMIDKINKGTTVVSGKSGQSSSSDSTMQMANAEKRN